MHAKRMDAIVHCADAGIAGLIFFALVPFQELLDGGDVGLRLVTIGLLSSLAWPVVLESLGVYESLRLRSIGGLAKRVALAGFMAAMIIGSGVWALSAAVPAGFSLTCAGLQAVVLFTVRLGVLAGLHVLRRSGRNYRNVLILGAGNRACDVAELIEQNRGWGLRVIGFVDSQDTPSTERLRGANIHKLVDLPAILREAVVDEVVVAVPRSMLDEIAPSVATCAVAGVPVTLMADLFDAGLPQPRPARLATRPGLSFAPVYHSAFSLGIKRCIDVVGSAAMLLLLAPLMGVIALLVRRSSPGPILFRQTRIGLYGRRFQVLKFRTMCEDAEERRLELADLNEMAGPVFKIKEDPRVTPLGRILRKWSLDELPQLWNVLRGDMALVGPRPPLPAEVAAYSTMERRRLSMRPGLTCLWQVSGRNEIPFDQWVQLDLQYIDRWSLLYDAQILLRTIPAVLSGGGR